MVGCPPNFLCAGLADRLKAARRKSGLSVDRVAKAARLGDGVTVFNIERKPGGVPRIDTIEKIAHGLQRSPAWLAYAIGGPAAPVQEVLRSTLVGFQLDLWLCHRSSYATSVARNAGISRPTVNNIVSGKTMPTVATVEAIAAAVHESPAWLAYGIQWPRWYRTHIEYLSQGDQDPDRESAAQRALAKRKRASSGWCVRLEDDIYGSAENRIYQSESED